MPETVRCKVLLYMYASACFSYVHDNLRRIHSFGHWLDYTDIIRRVVTAGVSGCNVCILCGQHTRSCYSKLLNGYEICNQKQEEISSLCFCGCLFCDGVPLIISTMALTVMIITARAYRKIDVRSRDRPICVCTVSFAREFPLQLQHACTLSTKDAGHPLILWKLPWIGSMGRLQLVVHVRYTPMTCDAWATCTYKVNVGCISLYHVTMYKQY